MSAFPSFVAPSSFQIGLRAVSRRSEKLFCNSISRQFSTNSRRFPITPCIRHPLLEILGPSRTPRNSQSHFQQLLLPRTAARTYKKFRAITHYTQLPDSYEDAAGTPFRKEDLNQREVNNIFGPHLTARDANELLRIIHGRRVAGTLDDPDLQQNAALFRADDKIKALEYLRQNIPVDEVVNAGLRAEDELRLLEAEMGEEVEQQFEETSPQNSPSEQKPVDQPAEECFEQLEQQPEARPERQPEVQPEEVKAPIGRLPKKAEEVTPYREGVFDRIRKRNEAMHEAEEKLKEEERIKREEEEALGNIGTLQTEHATPRALSQWRQKHVDRATSDIQEAPEMKAWERILPMFATTMLILGACVAFAVMYKPPRTEWRIWPDIPPAAATCIGFILVNTAIFGLWKFPPSWALFNKYMMVIAATPRPLQLIGAMFSHHTFIHLASNMVALWFFGIRLHDEIGRGNFLALYFASGTLGFFVSLCQLVLWRGLMYTTLGASGAVYGLIVGYFWNHRYDEFKVFGFPPDPWSGPQGLAFIGVIIGLHIWGLFSKSEGAKMQDIPSHFGGMLGGILGMHLIRKQMDDKARIRTEKLKKMGRQPEKPLDVEAREISKPDFMGKFIEPRPRDTPNSARS